MLDKLIKKEHAAGAPNPGAIFDFEVEKRLQCMTCKRCKYKKIAERQLQLTAPVAPNVEKDTPVELGLCLERFFADTEIEGVQCDHCNAKTTFTQRSRFITFPKVLAVVIQRFVFDDIGPKKLEIAMQVPKDGASLDLQAFESATKGELAPGEEALPTGAAKMVEPTLDQALLYEIIMMGIPELHAKHALHRTGNNDSNMAVTWYFENMADESLN